MAVSLEHLNYALLLIRRELGEDIALLACFLKLLVSHLLDLRAGQRHLRADAKPAADIDRNAFGVTRKYDSTHTILLQGGDSGACRFLRRIQESDESDEHHVALVLHAEYIYAVNVILLRYRDNADALEVVLFGDLFSVSLKLFADILDLAVDLDK